MKSLLNKEIKLAASPLSWFFLAGALMTMLPGYPILMSAFFICMGLFQSFQNARESNDVLYTALLPVRKRDFVRAKYAFSCLVQMIGFLLCAVLTAVRVVFLSTASAYVGNALMNATPVYLAFVLLIFTAFNALSQSASGVGAPYFASSSFSSEPELTPTRTATPFAAHFSMTERTFSAPPIFPGFILILSAPQSTESIASL